MKVVVINNKSLFWKTFPSVPTNCLFWGWKRSIRRKGLAIYKKGLWSEMGRKFMNDLLDKSFNILSLTIVWSISEDRLPLLQDVVDPIKGKTFQSLKEEIRFSNFSVERLKSPIKIDEFEEWLCNYEINSSLACWTKIVWRLWGA